MSAINMIPQGRSRCFTAFYTQVNNKSGLVKGVLDSIFLHETQMMDGAPLEWLVSPLTFPM